MFKRTLYVASAASVLALLASAAMATTTPLAGVTTAIDFTDLTSDLTSLMTDVLGLFLVIWAFKLGFKMLSRAGGR